MSRDAILSLIREGLLSYRNLRVEQTLDQPLPLEWTGEQPEAPQGATNEFSAFLHESIVQSGRKVIDSNSVGYLFCRTFIHGNGTPDSSLTFCYSNEALLRELNTYQRQFIWFGSVYNHRLLDMIKTHSLKQLVSRQRNQYKSQLTKMTLEESFKEARSLDHDKFRDDWREIYTRNLMAAVDCLTSRGPSHTSGAITVRNLRDNQAVKSVRNSSKPSLNPQSYLPPSRDDTKIRSTKKLIAHYDGQISRDHPATYDLHSQTRSIFGLEGTANIASVEVYRRDGKVRIRSQTWRNADGNLSAAQMWAIERDCMVSRAGWNKMLSDNSDGLGHHFDYTSDCFCPGYRRKYEAKLLELACEKQNEVLLSASSPFRIVPTLRLSANCYNKLMKGESVTVEKACKFEPSQTGNTG